MTLWTYRATTLDRPPTSDAAPLEGLIDAATRKEARARLRSAGLQALTIRARPEPWRGRYEARSAAAASASVSGAGTGHGPSPRATLGHTLSDLARRRVLALARSRRIARRAELADAVATLLDAGLPLHDALMTVAPGRGPESLRSHVTRLREGLKSGRSLSDCAADAPGWFDHIDCALIGAGEAAGALARSLRCIAARLERQAQGRARLIGILAYPALVTCVALGVVLFLASHTLPELSRTLTSGGIEPPLLTEVVITFGQSLLDLWWLLPTLPALVLVATLPLATERGRALAHQAQDRLTRLSLTLTPSLMRSQALGTSIRTLADLIGAGIPLAHALRITAPTSHPSLGRALSNAAHALESGTPLSSAFACPVWFDAEFRRLLELAQSTGTLEASLLQLTARLERRAERAAQTLARVLEPALIVLLSLLVGVVVMAAVLPLARLQEILP